MSSSSSNIMNTLVLAARSHLEQRREKKEHTCPVENTEGPDIVYFVGEMTYHRFATLLSLGCGILSTVIVFVLVMMHAFNYSNPVQQRQVIRIVSLIPWVSLFSFLIVWQVEIGDYLELSLDFGCSIALSSFLLFMCDLVLSHPGGFESLFDEPAGANPQRKSESPQWLRRTWYGVLQFIPMTAILWAATAISLAVGTYCKQSNSPHFAHIWIAVLKAGTMVVAIIYSLRFYKRNKPLLSKHGILLKLMTFKGVLGLNFLQSFIISILAGNGVLKPTQYMTYHDVNTGLPSLLLACEMPIFAVLLIFAFSPLPYKRAPDGPASGALNAIVDAINLSDLLGAFFRGPMRLVRDQQRQILRQRSMKIQVLPNVGDEENIEYRR